MDRNNGMIIPVEDSENNLFNEISILIEQSRRVIYSQASSTTILLFWEIGKRINDDILKNKRADYGKQIVSRVATQLSWSHIVEILPLKSHEAKLYYLNEAARGLVGRDALRVLISRKAFERKEIADTQISISSPIPQGIFKDPYLLDVLGIKDEYLEADLEEAILRELEKFILEFGNGFSFVERQKRMILDGHDRYLDLLFFNRELRRLVAVELKIGRFRAEHKGQMQLYLAWLDKHERKEWEESPVGLILCSESGRDELELLKLDRDGILVAEYWTALPPKAEFEQKIQTILSETRERMEQRKLM